MFYNFMIEAPSFNGPVFLSGDLHKLSFFSPLGETRRLEGARVGGMPR